MRKFITDSWTVLVFIIACGVVPMAAFILIRGIIPTALIPFPTALLVFWYIFCFIEIFKLADIWLHKDDTKEVII